MPHSERVQYFKKGFGDNEDIDDHWKDRTNTSSPDEVEDGFVVISDEATAEWDGDQTRYVPPTPYQSAVQSAKHRCGLGLSYLQNTIDKAASVVAQVAEEALPTALAPRRRQSSIMDITGWKPPKNAFDRELSDPKNSREMKLSDYRQHMVQKARGENESGIQFVEETEAYDTMGVSTAWQKPEKREDEKRRRQRLLEGWKAREERQKSLRGGEYGRELDDTRGTRSRPPNQVSHLPKLPARGVSDRYSTRASMDAAMSTGTAPKAASPKDQSGGTEMDKTQESEARRRLQVQKSTVKFGRQWNSRDTVGEN